MIKDGLSFELIDGKVKISTNQIIDEDEFAKRIASIESKKKNFKMQIDFMMSQIEENKKNIDIQLKNIEFAEEDLTDAYKFLHDNNRKDIILKIDTKIEEIEKQNKADAEKQMAMQQ